MADETFWLVSLISATAAILLTLPLDCSSKSAVYLRQFRCIYAIYSLALLTAECIKSLELVR